MNSAGPVVRSYVQKKRNRRWLWWVQDHDTGQVVAFVFGRRTKATFRRLRSLLEQAGIVVSRWFTDYWWAYYDELPSSIHQVGKDQTQSIERKHRTGDPAGFTNPNQAISASDNLLFKVGFDA
jgi:IS1 family transposase